MDQDGLPVFDLKRAVNIAHARRKDNGAVGHNANDGDANGDDDDDDDEDAAADKDSNLLRRILSISREMKFPKDVVWPPAAEMDFDFAGKGYGRSPGTSHGILHELVDQKADGDSNGVFFRRSTHSGWASRYFRSRLLGITVS